MTHDNIILPFSDAEARYWLPEGTELPKTPKGDFGYHVRVDEQTHKKLVKMSDRENITISNVVKNLVDEKMP